MREPRHTQLHAMQPNITGPTEHQMLNMPRIDTSRLFEIGKLLGRPRLAQTRTTSIHRPTIQLSFFKFICHPCVAKPSPILQDDISFTMRSIEHKLDILTSSVVGGTIDPDTDITTSRQKPSFAETTAKAVVRQIEQSNRLPLQTTHPSPSPSGIANEVWRHIERRQK